MLQLRNFRCIRQQLPLVRYISSTPSNKNVKPPRIFYDQLTEKIFVDDLLTRTGRKPFQPLVEEPIIAKKFFNAQVDDSQMLFPEVLAPQRFETLNELRWKVDDYILDHLRFDIGGGVTQDVHTEFQQMQLYGYNVPKEYGGQGYNMSELALLSEPEGQNTSAALSLNVHRQACEIINRYCTDEQRAKYLPRLATGELVGTVAFDEWHDNELKSVKMMADLDDDTNEWCLKGGVILMPLNFHSFWLN